MMKNKGRTFIFANRILLLSAALILIIPFNYIPQNVQAPGPPIVDPTIEEIISKVTEQHVEGYITDLQNFNTRYVYTSQCNLSGQYIYDEFCNYSALSVENDYFVYNSYLVRNIIATLPGLNTSDSTVYLVGGHYDSTSITDRWNNAPGADDDASGTAVALEAAKILSQYRFNSTIKFAAWTAEEAGLRGSGYFARNAALGGMDIGAYLNFDMIGYDPDNKMGLDIGHNAESIWLSDEMVSINENYSIGLNITTGPGGGSSDHASFWSWGYPAVTCIESVFNTPNYHTINDTVDKLNMEFDKKVTQLGLATLAKLAGVLTPGVGVIYLDKVAYQPRDTVSIRVYDTDLNSDPGLAEQVLVELSSNTEMTPEIVTLTETDINTSIFVVTIDTKPGAPGMDGFLQVTEGDTITAEYQDFAPIGIRRATATIDGTPPIISDVAAVLGVDGATITWTTDEPSDSKVHFGLSQSLGFEVYDSKMVTAHSIEILGLEPCLTYYFDVESTDYANNSQRDDNNGAHYNFTTLLGITTSSKSGYVGWVRESQPSVNYFDGPDIYVGHGAKGIYHGAAQFNVTWFPKDANITNATVEFYGKRWHYTGTGGGWVLQMLDSTIDDGWQAHGYTDIHDALVEDAIPPTMQDDDLQPRHWNTFIYDPDQLTTLENHVANNTISFRLDGPQPGTYLFIWDTGYGYQSWGIEYAPRIILTYNPVGDANGPECTDIHLTPNPTYGVNEVTLSAVLSDGSTGGSNITCVKYYDPISNSWIYMEPEDGSFDSFIENVKKTIDISSWPDGNHTIFVRGLDEAGNWGDMVPIVLEKKPTFDIPLNFGWNLVSIPINLSNNVISDVLASISGDFDAVRHYDAADPNDPWKYNHTSKPPYLNDLDNIDHTMGFWIHITKPGGATLQCTGSPFQEDHVLDIYPGWNLVGYPSLMEMAPDSAGLPSGVDAVFWYNSISGQWEIWDPGTYHDPDTLTLLKPGQGLWIHNAGVTDVWLIDYLK